MRWMETEATMKMPGQSKMAKGKSMYVCMYVRTKIHSFHVCMYVCTREGEDDVDKDYMENDDNDNEMYVAGERGPNLVPKVVLPDEEDEDDNDNEEEKSVDVSQPMYVRMYVCMYALFNTLGTMYVHVVM